MKPISERLALAADPNTPSSVLTSLSDDRARQVMKAVAANPSTPPEVLNTLAKNFDWHIRGAVAGNPSTPADVLYRLSHDSMALVRHPLALNPSTPPSVLEYLVDLSHTTDFDIARHPNATSKTRFLARMHSPFRTHYEKAADDVVVDMLRNVTRTMQELGLRTLRLNCPCPAVLMYNISRYVDAGVSEVSVLGLYMDPAGQIALKMMPRIPGELINNDVVTGSAAPGDLEEYVYADNESIDNLSLLRLTDNIAEAFREYVDEMFAQDENN